MSPVHDYTPIPFPNSVPEHLAKAVSEAGEEEVVFDPKIHLQLEPPEFLVTLDFEKVPFPLPKEKAKQLAYSTPFRLLSDEGIRVMHDIVMKNVKHSSSDERIACKIRGLGYLSKFVRDFNRCPEIEAFLSQMSGEEICAHGTPMNYSHTNIGRPNADGRKFVDQWHLDSVEYVTVVIVSDLEGLEGGALQVINSRKEKAWELLAEAAKQGKEIDESFVNVVKYPKAGWSIFMQGCEMVHSVSAVVKANEPRMSVVNSFTPKNCFCPRSGTRYSTNVRTDGERVADVEFARYQAWRTQGQMDYLLNKATFSATKEELVELMTKAAEELLSAGRILKGEESDWIGWFDAKAGKETLSTPSAKKDDKNDDEGNKN